jgi:multiple sugar transport system permease protein/raffinose/stachyose/melibiose transport system permease protein
MNQKKRVARGDKSPRATRLDVAGLSPWARLKNSWFVFALPALIFVAVFWLVALAINIYLAFTDWNSFRSETSFIGFENFSAMYVQGTLVNAIRLTFIFALVTMLVQNLAGLGMALVYEKDSPASTFFRSLFFVPVLLSFLAVGFVWRGLLQPAGLVNSVLSLFVPGSIDKAWLADPTWSIVVIALINAWMWTGMSALIYLANLKAIPTDLVEASVVDGASAWQRFRHIKFPLLGPALTFNITLTFIGSLNVFDMVVATTRGGPGRSTRVLNVLIRDQFAQGLFAFASATNLIVTIMIVVITIPLVWLLRTREVEL